jgi:hypothetical protein
VVVGLHGCVGVFLDGVNSCRFRTPIAAGYTCFAGSSEVVISRFISTLRNILSDL